MTSKRMDRSKYRENIHETSVMKRESVLSTGESSFCGSNTCEDRFFENNEPEWFVEPYSYSEETDRAQYCSSSEERSSDYTINVHHNTTNKSPRQDSIPAKPRVIFVQGNDNRCPNPTSVPQEGNNVTVATLRVDDIFVDYLESCAKRRNATCQELEKRQIVAKFNGRKATTYELREDFAKTFKQMEKTNDTTPRRSSILLNIKSISTIFKK